MTAADLQSGSRFLLDTNVLLRLQSTSRSGDDAYASLATSRLRIAKARLFVAFQNISEFWNSSTRPQASNGLGLSVLQASEQLRRIEQITSLLTDTREVYEQWRELLVAHAVAGKQVHDTRLAATMLVYNVPFLLTYNIADFRRFRSITAIHPQELA